MLNTVITQKSNIGFTFDLSKDRPIRICGLEGIQELSVKHYLTGVQAVSDGLGYELLYFDFNPSGGANYAIIQMDNEQHEWCCIELIENFFSDIEHQRVLKYWMEEDEKYF